MYSGSPRPSFLILSLLVSYTANTMCPILTTKSPFENIFVFVLLFFENFTLLTNIFLLTGSANSSRTNS